MITGIGSLIRPYVKMTLFKLFLLSQRESFVTVKIFESKILVNFDVFEVTDSE